MVKPHIDQVTLDIVCPTCMQSGFTVFRRDPEANRLSLNHCKCACGQLFVYHVDDSNQPVLDPAAFLATQPNERVPSDGTLQTMCCPRCKGEQFDRLPTGNAAAGRRCCTVPGAAPAEGT